MSSSKLTPLSFAQTPTTIDISGYPPYDPERQLAVSKDLSDVEGVAMAKMTTQTFTHQGQPKDADAD